MAGAKRVKFIAGFLAVSILLTACDGDGGGDGTTAATGTTSETEPVGGGTTITIEDFAFEPNTITVSGPTNVTVANRDSVTHTFTLDDGSVTELIAGGETATVTVDVSETTGWVCNVHPEMTGTIEIA